MKYSKHERGIAKFGLGICAFIAVLAWPPVALILVVAFLASIAFNKN